MRASGWALVALCLAVVVAVVLGLTIAGVIPLGDEQGGQSNASISQTSLTPREIFDRCAPGVVEVGRGLAPMLPIRVWARGLWSTRTARSSPTHTL